jgi:hypothetical protein
VQVWPGQVQVQYVGTPVPCHTRFVRKNGESGM